MASKFSLFGGSNGEFYFRLKAGNGETILNSEGYKPKASCQSGIASVKTNAPLDSRYERRTSSNSKEYFVLKAANGEIIGTSQMYSSGTARDQGIEAVKREAPGASVEDLT